MGADKFFLVFVSNALELKSSVLWGEQKSHIASPGEFGTSKHSRESTKVLYFLTAESSRTPHPTLLSAEVHSSYLQVVMDSPNPSRFHISSEVVMSNFEVHFLCQSLRSVVLKRLNPFDLLLILTPK